MSTEWIGPGVDYPEDEHGRQACSVCLGTCLDREWVQLIHWRVGDQDGWLQREYLDEDDEPSTGPVIHLECFTVFAQATLAETAAVRRSSE